MHDYHNNTVEIKEKTVSMIEVAAKHFYLCRWLCYSVLGVSLITNLFFRENRRV